MTSLRSICRALRQIDPWQPEDDATLNALQNIRYHIDDPSVPFVRRMQVVSYKMYDAKVLLIPRAMAWARIQICQFANQRMKSSRASLIADYVAKRALGGLQQTLEQTFSTTDSKFYVQCIIWKQQTPFLYHLKNELKETILEQSNAC